MTKFSARKRTAREYAQAHGVAYRQALAVIRNERPAPDESCFDDFVTRLLIEAVEGCGIRHWALIREWDGASTAVIADLGGEVFDLSADSLGECLRDYLVEEHLIRPLDIDSFHADDVVQRALFGGTIYRPGVRRRPQTSAA